MEKKTRLDVPDIMKGLCIILVVMQHCFWLPDADTHVVTRVYLCMNMPMFFFVSGLFLPVGRGIGTVAVHSARRLLVPWLVFALVSGVTVSALMDSPPVSVGELHRWLFIGPNTPLYFLRALFFAIILARCAAWLPSGMVWQTVVLAVFAAMSWVVVSLGTDWPLRNLGIHEAASMVMYMWLGHMCSVWLKDFQPSRVVALGVFVVSLAAACVLSPGRMRWHYQETGESWTIVTACAILGIAAIWALACMLRGFRPLSALGRRTMQVLVLHYFILLAFIAWLGCDRDQAGLLMLGALPVAMYACERLVPFIFGEKTIRWSLKRGLST